uniref:Protein kinase domain-containing protein n=1 Tax=Steinernema glaseri TaxID=37863 RepID=A0A1I8A991_9BILA
MSQTATSVETSSSSSESFTPNFYEGDLICGRWKVEGEIGRGGCGVVYQVSTKVTEQVNGVMKEHTIRAAMKCEGVDPEDRYSETLHSEVTVLRRMQLSEHVCRLYLGGRLSASVNILIMSLVGRSLSFMRRLCRNQRFSMSTAIRVGYQCLEAIKELHFIGYLHRDIKAGNFAIGTYPGNVRRIVLLDFGFARQYVKKGSDGRMRHRSPRHRAPFLGTDRYCSVNCADRKEQGRCDDLWSWIFMLVEFIEGKLPWKDFGGEVEELNKKKRAALDTLLDRCPRQLYRIFDHINDLEYSDRPNYDLMFNTLREICEAKRIHPDDPYDWEEGGRCHEQFLEAEAARPQMKTLERRPEDEPMESMLNSDCDYFSDNMLQSKASDRSSSSLDSDDSYAEANATMPVINSCERDEKNGESYC